ncbi:molybdopterin-dependent oxidoreductase [Halobium salinum]|uniref:Molybdopterin-dependent oxidoreductase n=1 Tax=Halobium salinum TaxID=1364940 RepID=A0ABD5PB87_9EURY|nr:molybdopterin-dependent oxidoreductase [Halobium salinum]
MFPRSPRRARRAATVLFAFAAGFAGVLGSYLAVGLRPTFVASPVSSALVRVMPDAVVRFAIVTLTDFGRSLGIDHLGATANLLLAVLLAAAALGGLGVAGLLLGGRRSRPLAGVVVGSLLVAVSALLVTGSAASAVGAGAAAGALLVTGVALLGSTAEGGTPAASATGVSDGRRRTLGALATAFVGTVAGVSLFGRGDGAGAGAAAGGSESGDGNDALPIDTGTTSRLLDEAESRAFDVGGLEGLVSGDDFYTVDINNADPDVAAADWSLSVTGAVANAYELSYDDLLDRETVHEFVTLRCVSDRLNGRKMDTDLWSGVSAEALLDEADPQGEYVVLRAADGYYEEFPLSAFEGGLLAFAKGGETLPRKHGYPLRALVLGHWGEVNVKWLTEIEIHEEPVTGFWEKKGWHGTGPVETVAKLHGVERGEGTMTVAGHAYAGTRGIERVEVSTDGGDSWSEATLSERLPAGTGRSPEAKHAADAWRQWRYEYEKPDDTHEVVVRAVDGEGDRQPKGDGEAPDGDRKPFPSGATGWVSKTLEP